ncbi:hypothetical protein SteCoe_35678 [Stentor coeruleus]|uniref:KAP NTPase domain-containing protein n=1 Tax=Stentor coeruleus TaxID=5963 RepID=A0A1R2ARQ5_9CILI|nr:hypothetical protein SteCoe_35678 [Stentor coeruleus]
MNIFNKKSFDEKYIPYPLLDQDINDKKSDIKPTIITESNTNKNSQLDNIKENEITILLIGESGSGKTSMIKSLIYILEDKLPYNKPFDDIISNTITYYYEDINSIAYIYNHQKSNTKITFVELPGIECKMDKILEDKMMNQSVDIVIQNCPKINFVIVTQRGDQRSMNNYLYKVLMDLKGFYTDEKAFKIILAFTFYADSLVFGIKSFKIDIETSIKVNNCVDVQKDNKKSEKKWEKCVKKLRNITNKLELGS